jgi:superfamily II DNA or RNA helicase
VYQDFCAVNASVVDEQAFFRFVQQMTAIAAEVRVVPRPEQLVAMFSMLHSQYERTLMQLPTGSGKSLMLGLMARYLNVSSAIKAVVVVPNEVLAAIQQ